LSIQQKIDFWSIKMNGLHETAIIVPHQSQKTGQSDFNGTYPQGDGQTHCQRQNWL
jgi:hypothetical protein